MAEDAKKKAVWPIADRASDMEKDNGKVDKGMRTKDATKLATWRNERKV